MSERDVWTPEERRIQLAFKRRIEANFIGNQDPAIGPIGMIDATKRADELRSFFRELFPGASPDAPSAPAEPDRYVTHGKDTQTHVYFYPSEFYCLSNFSPDRVGIWGLDFDTAEHAYHWVKFAGKGELQYMVRTARSAHMAFRIGQDNKGSERAGWAEQREYSMLDILTAKYSQHEYVRRLLARTGDRIIVEDSFRDSYWGAGPDGLGLNRLGALWMKLRDDKIGKSSA